jgi:hypothetical protein
VFDFRSWRRRRRLPTQQEASELMHPAVMKAKEPLQRLLQGKQFS